MAPGILNPWSFPLARSKLLSVQFPRVISAATTMDEFPRPRFTAPGWNKNQRGSGLMHPITMDFNEHVQVGGGALKHWFIAQLQDSIAVGILWLIGLYII